MLIAESGRVHLHGVVTMDVRLSFIQQAKPSLQYGQSVIKCMGVHSLYGCLY